MLKVLDVQSRIDPCTPNWFQVWKLKKVKTLIIILEEKKNKTKKKEHYINKGQGCILPKKIILGGKGKESDPTNLSANASTID